MKRALLPVLLCVYGATGQSRIEMKPFDGEHEILRLNENGRLEEYEAALSSDSGSIFVPERRADDASRKIQLPIVRVRATISASHPPVFWLSGGPGQTNMKSFRFDYFIDSSDHVMVGYRGADGEVDLNCPEVVDLLEDAGDILDPEVLRRVGGAYSDCAKRLTATGIDIGSYTPVEVAKDIDEARSALGYEKITVVSESYGTRVAYYYAVMFPERVHRMVMIGGNPPGCMVWNPRQQDSLLVRYSELWAQDEEASSKTPDLIAAFRKVNADFPERWLFFPIHEGTVKTSVNAFLFNMGTAAQAFDAYAAAAEGDASGLWLMSLVGGMIFPTVSNWGDNASKAMSADYDSTLDYTAYFMPEGGIFGSPLGAFLWSPGQHGAWPARPIPERFKKSEICSVRALFLSGSLDFSTPAANVESGFVPFFPNGTHVIVSEAGHVGDLWRSQPAASRRLVHTFIRKGEIDTTLMRYASVSFDVSMGFPTMAKLALGAFVVVGALIVWGIWWGVQKAVNR